MSEDRSESGIPPDDARAHEARQSGTWTSALSTAEFAAIRSVGFEPVAQAMGVSVQQIGWNIYRDCGYRSRFVLFERPSRTRTFADGAGSGGPGQLLVRALYNARRLALNRLITKCDGLGGDGVVGVRLTVGRFLSADILEFQAIGTAVRAQGPVRPHRPFVCHLSGQDFAKLIGTGWVPIDLVLGISLGIRHDDRSVRRSTARFTGGNVEVDGWTELVSAVRHEARKHLQEDAVRTGGDGCVLSGVTLDVRERECGWGENGRDHIAEAGVLGTALAAFRPRATTGPPSLTVLCLDPERRRRARREGLSSIRPLSSY